MNIQIADSHAALRADLRNILRRRPDLRIVAEADSVTAAVTQAAQEQPDLIVADSNLQDGDGLKLLQRFRQAAPSAKILVLATAADAQLVQQSLAGGARAFVLKDAVTTEFVCAIDAIAAGGVYLSDAAAAALVTMTPSPSGAGRLHSLSPREMQVLQLIVAGHQGKEIAERLGVSLSSAGTYRERLLRKLGCTSTAALVRLAIAEGLAT